MNKILSISEKEFVSLPDGTLTGFFGKTAARKIKTPGPSDSENTFSVAGYLSSRPVVFSEDAAGKPVSLNSSIRKAHLSGTRFLVISNSEIYINGDWLFAFYGMEKNDEKTAYDHLTDYIRSHAFKNPVIFLRDAFKTDVMARMQGIVFLSDNKHLFVFKGKNSRLQYAHIEEKWVFCSHNISGIDFKPVKSGHLLIIDKEAKLIDASDSLSIEYLNNYAKVIPRPLPR
jgi:hypothetical protein